MTNILPHLVQNQQGAEREKTRVHTYVHAYVHAYVHGDRESHDRGETRGRFAYTRLPATWLPFVLYLPDDLPTPGD